MFCHISTIRNGIVEVPEPRDDVVRIGCGARYDNPLEISRGGKIEEQ